MNKTNQYVTSRVKLTIGERINYAVAEFGYNSIYVWISTFMVIFCTDVLGISPVSVSLLLLLVRIFDAINDPIIGSIADRTKSKWGRYKPWVAIGATVMSLLIIVLFAAQPGWSNGVKTAYVWIVYTLITVASTACNMPYGALNGVITSDTEERTKLSGMRMVFVNIGGNFTPLIAPALMLFFAGGVENSAKGYLFAVIFSVALGLPTLIWSAVKSKERVQPPPEQMEAGNKIPFKTQIKTLTGNKYAIVSMVGQFMNGFLAYGRMAIMAYYFTYVSEDFSLLARTGIIGIIAGVLGSGWLCPFIYKMLRHKGRAVGISFLIAGLFYAPMFFLNAHGVAFWVFYFLSALFGGAAGALRYSCDGDNADYAEYKYGVRVDGFLSSFISLMLKFGGAVGPAVLMAWIGKLGYIANQPQNDAVRNALNLSMSIVPAVLAVVAAAAFFIFHDMDEKKHKEIVDELERRRGITSEE